MNTVQRIAKNTAILLAANIISRVISFFYVMYTARYLGAEGFGILSFALAFTGIFGVFADLGLKTLTVRDVARDKSLAGKYLRNIIAIKIFLVIITFGLIVITIYLLGYPKQTIKVVYFIALSVIFNAFSGMYYSIFQAYEKMEYQSLGNILSNILIFLGFLFAISQGFSVIVFASIYFLVSIIIFGYTLFIYEQKFILPKIEFDWEFWKAKIKEALPFGLTGTFITIYLWMDSVMLSFVKGEEVVGWYNAAYKLILTLLFIPGIINTAIFPSMSRFYISSQNSLKLIHEKYFKFMLVIGIPIGIGTTFLADRIILLIYGEDFIPTIIILKILIWSLVLIFFRTSFDRLFESIGKQIIVSEAFGIGVILNLILNLTLIPKYSYIGAAVATVITDLVIFILLIVFSLKVEYCIIKKKYAIILFKVIGSSILMVAFIKYFRNLNLLLLVLLSVIVYFLFMFLVKGFSKDDISLFKKLISKKKAIDDKI